MGLMTQKDKEVIKNKQGKRQDEQDRFIKNISNDEDERIEGEVGDFIDETTEAFMIFSNSEKKTEFSSAKKGFEKRKTRKNLQRNIDIDISKGKIPIDELIHYLEKPDQLIEKRYKEIYEQVWEEVNTNFFQN